MAKNKNEAAPSQEPDADLTAGAPVDLPGDDAGETQNYLPSVRQGMGVALPDDGELMDLEGVRPPFLTLVHGTSKELIERFNAGDLVLKKEHCVCKKGDRLQAVFLARDQYQKERISQDDWGEGRRPRTFKTKEAAAAAGLCVVWDDAKGLKPEVGPAMDLVMLIRRNEGVSDALFGVDLGIEDGGKPTEWGFCLLSLDKTAYKVFINDIGLTVNNKLKAAGGLYTGLWDLSAELAPASPKSSNRPFVIRARFKGLLDPVVVGNIKNAMSVPVSAPDVGEEFP